MNSLDQLINQSAALLRIIDELISLITKAKNENNLSKKQLNALMDNVTKTLNLVKLFEENYNEFIANQVESG